jgi:hypothetical protein
MTRCRTLAIFAIAALFSAGAIAVEAQDAVQQLGSVRVRPRFFNPFDIGSNRLTLNPFGMIAFAQAGPSSVAATSTAAATSAALEDTGATTGVSAGIRPPFRPPVRSPFRPPPRPPF